MDRDEALRIIDQHKNQMLDPTEMLAWTWLRVIIAQIDDNSWANAVDRAMGILSK